MKQILLLLTILFISCAEVQTDKPKIKLYVFDCGENNVKDISIFSPGFDKGVQKTLVARCYLISHPQGLLMWDTGLSDSISNKPDGLSVRNGVFTLSVKKTLSSQLKELKIDPQSIDYLAFSHMHPDHSGNANLFKNSKVLLQSKEFEAAFGSNPKKYSFNKQLYSEIQIKNIIKLNDDYDVFGDGSVKIIKTPGHTPGHQSLYIDLPKTGKIVLSGDLYHFQKNRTYKRVPSFNFDKEMTKRSMDKLEAFLVKNKATLWIQHDPDQAKTIKLSPAYYE